jgi:cell division septum initiation protein DivIVA
MTYHDSPPGPGSGIAEPPVPEMPLPGRPPETQENTSTAETAKEEASKVTDEARRQVRDLTGQTRDELTSQARQQKDRAVGGLRALSEELQSMSGSSEQSGMAGDLAQEAARRTGDFAGWLDSREPGELIDEVRTFARQRPGLFLALAAGAGVLAGRLTRGMTQAESPQDATS